MRPLTLRFEGINSFVSKQSVDFEALSAEGLFGVFGPTASGKSTVIDAITLALYGKIARFDGDHKFMFINKEAANWGVELEFEAGGERYLVRKGYGRAQKDGKFELREKNLSRFADGEYVPLNLEKEKEITDFTTKLLGLSFDDFTRSVLLPQGKFAEFLFLQNKERALMLERIFRLEKYGQSLLERANRRERENAARLSELRKVYAEYADISAAGLEEKRSRLDVLRAELSEKKREAGEEAERVNRLRALNEANAELAAYEERLKAETDRAGAMREKRKRLSLAKNAAGLSEIIARAENLEIEKTRLELDTERFKTAMDRASGEYSGVKALYDAAVAVREKDHAPLLEKEGKLRIAVSLMDENRAKEGELVSLIAAKTENAKIIEEAENSLGSLSANRKAASARLEELSAKKAALMRKLGGRDDVYAAYELEKRLAEQKRLKREADGKLATLAESLRADEAGLAETELEYRRLDGLFAKAEAEKKALADCPVNEEKLTEDRLRVHTLEAGLKSLGELLDRRRADSDEERRLSELCAGLSDKSARARSELGELESELFKTTDAITAFRENNILGALAGKLSEGAPCPVCGSAEHPAPAREIGEAALEALEYKKRGAESRIELLRRELNAFERELFSAQARHENARRRGAECATLVAGRDYREEELRLAEESFALENARSALTDWRAKKVSADERFETLSVLRNAKFNSASELRASALARRERMKEDSENAGKLARDIAGLEKELADYALKLGSGGFERLWLDIKAADAELGQTDGAEKRGAAYLEENRAEQEALNAALSRAKSGRAGLSAKIDAINKIINENKAKISAVSGGDPGAELAAVSKRISLTLENEKKLHTRNEEAAEELRRAENVFSTGAAKLKSVAEQSEASRRELWEKLSAQGFANIRDAKDGLLPDAEISALEKETAEYDAGLSELKTLIASRGAVLEGIDRSGIRNGLSEAETRLVSLREAESGLSEALGAETQLVGQYDEKLRKSFELKRELDEATGLGDLLGEMKTLFRGNKFVEFIARRKLAQITLDASERLGSMTRGRYALELDGADFIARDDFNGGERRAPKTLSGGESFIVSLCLALALSSGARGRAGDFFFLDEGFGTLDSAALSTVMDALTELTRKEITIGLISHVAELKERVARSATIIPAESGEGGSRIT